MFVMLLIAIEAVSIGPAHATSKRRWPPGCTGREVLDYTKGLASIKKFYYCASGGYRVSGANIIPCEIRACGHDIRATLATAPRRTYTGGGPSCQVVQKNYKICANGRHADVLTAIAWLDPQTNKVVWKGVGRFAPHDAVSLSHYVKKVWKHVTVRKCTAMAIGTTAATGISIVTSGGLAAPVAVTIVAGSTGGCISGALSYIWGA
jgi:hypothetical protein